MMTIQQKAKKLLTVLPRDDYRYVVAAIVSATKTDNLRHNSVRIVEKTYAIYFGKEKR